MPDELGPTVYELEFDIHRIRQDIERLFAQSAKRMLKQGDPSLWLTLKEIQRQCPNLPPIPPG